MAIFRNAANEPGHFQHEDENDGQNNSSQQDESSPQSIENELIAAYANWVEAFGTFVSAVGSDPSLNSQLSNDLGVIGNIIQAGATAVVTDTEETWNLNKLGNVIDGIGLIEEAAGGIFNITNQTEQLIIFLQGNLLQALGNSLTTLYSLQQPPTIPNLYGFYGNATELSGLIIEISGEAIQLRNNAEATDVTTTLNVLGNWVQVAGAVITAIGQSLSYEEAIQKNATSSDSSAYASRNRLPTPYY